MITADIVRVQCAHCDLWMDRDASNALRSDNRPPFYDDSHLLEARSALRGMMAVLKFREAKANFIAARAKALRETEDANDDES